jgi:hypothetical protein
MRAFQIPSSARRAILLGTIIAATATGCQLGAGSAGSGGLPTTPTTVATPSVVPSDPRAALGDPTVQRLLGDLRAARAQHDLRTFHRLRNALANLLGAAAITDADGAYRRVVASLNAAAAFHDAPARARYRAQLRALCDPAGLTSAIEPCEIDLSLYAR